MNFSKLKLFTTIAGPAQKKPDNPETGNKNNENVHANYKAMETLPRSGAFIINSQRRLEKPAEKAQKRHGRVKTFDDKKWHWEKGVGQLL